MKFLKTKALLIVFIGLLNTSLWAQGQGRNPNKYIIGYGSGLTESESIEYAWSDLYAQCTGHLSVSTGWLSRFANGRWYTLGKFGCFLPIDDFTFYETGRARSVINCDDVDLKSLTELAKARADDNASARCFETLQPVGQWQIKSQCGPIDYSNERYLEVNATREYRCSK